MGDGDRSGDRRTGGLGGELALRARGDGHLTGPSLRSGSYGGQADLGTGRFFLGWGLALPPSPSINSGCGGPGYSLYLFCFSFNCVQDDSKKGCRYYP